MSVVCLIWDSGLKRGSHICAPNGMWCAQFHQALDSFSGSMLPLENHGHCDTSKQELRQDLFAVNKQVPAKGYEIVYMFDYLNNFGILNKDRQN